MSQPNTRFHHGYTHCKGIDCPTADDCAIHMAYEEAVKLNLNDIKTIDTCGDDHHDYVRVRIGEKGEDNG